MPSSVIWSQNPVPTVAIAGLPPWRPFRITSLSWHHELRPTSITIVCLAVTLKFAPRSSDTWQFVAPQVLSGAPVMTADASGNFTVESISVMMGEWPLNANGRIELQVEVAESE